MTLTDNVTKWAEEGWGPPVTAEGLSAGACRAANDFFLPGFVYHGRGEITYDLVWLKAYLVEKKTECPDLTVTVDDIVEQGDKVALRWTLHSKTSTTRGCGICHFEHGKAKEFWGLTTD